MKTMNLSLPVKAPFPWQVVALRCSSSVINVQIGSGLLHITLKYLHWLMLSITLSTRRDVTPSPRIEYSAVSISKTKKLAKVIMQLVASNAFPMSNEVYFRRIIAIISVPPLEAPILKRIAEPMAGRMIAKHNSNTGWSVNGASSGCTHSKIEIVTDSRMLQYAVLAIKDFPKKKVPITSKVRLTIKLNVLGVMGVTCATTTESPVIPPKVKLLVNLK